jgi:RNA polymerase sigma-70 factor (ECF subfamily)
MLMQISQASDAVLVYQTQGGDVAAFGRLVERYQNAIYGLAFHLMRNFADAEDLAQDTFVAAYESIARIREPAKFAGWLRSIAYNQWRMQRRRVSAYGLEVSTDDENHACLLSELVDPSPTPDALVLQDERLRAVMQAIALLPETTQLVTTLYYLHDLSYREIADLLDLSPSTIQSRLQRARQKLKGEMIKMAQDLFSEHRLTPEFVRRIIGRIQGFALSGSGNLPKLFPDANARALYLSLYPEGQHDTGAAQKLGYSEEEYTQILKLWEDTNIIKRQDTRLIAQIPVYTMEDMRRCNVWIERAAETIQQVIQTRRDEYEEFAAELSHGDPSMQSNLIGILISFYTLNRTEPTLEDQYSMPLSTPERPGIGAFKLWAHGENAEGKHLFNIGTNIYYRAEGTFNLFHCEAKVKRERMWQFIREDWIDRGFPVVGLLVKLAAAPRPGDDLLQIAVETGFREEFAAIIFDDLKTLGFISPTSPHRLLIPYLDASDVGRAEALGDRVAVEAVTAIGNPEPQLRTIIQTCSFGQCSFADVFNMLFHELKGAVIEQLIQRGIMMPLPPQANAEWGCWLEARNH